MLASAAGPCSQPVPQHVGWPVLRRPRWQQSQGLAPSIPSVPRPHGHEELLRCRELGEGRGSGDAAGMLQPPAAKGPAPLPSLPGHVRHKQERAETPGE